MEAQGGLHGESREGKRDSGYFRSYVCEFGKGPLSQIPTSGVLLIVGLLWTTMGEPQCL